MAENDRLKRYLDAGLAFTQMTQKRAEAIARDLVKAGEVQRDQAQALVEDLLERSRENTERLLDSVRKEVRDQLKGRRLATQADIARLEDRINRLAGAGTAKSSAGSRKGAAKKRSAKKRSAKKRSAKKPSAKKRSAKRRPS